MNAMDNPAQDWILPMKIYSLVAILSLFLASFVNAGTPTIAGVPAVKSTLNVAGVSPRNRDESATIQWQVADQKSGPFLPMQGVTGPRCVIPPSLAGKWLKAQLTPSVSTDAVRIKDRPGNPNVDFMHRTGWGLSFTFDREYIQRVAINDAERIGKDAGGKTESWDATLATFDVAAFAKEVEATGASFILLALEQNSGYCCAPNATMDEYVGVAPGVYCSKRDLPLEIMRALAPKGIRVMLYLPGNPPVHNRAVRDGMSYAGTGNDAPSQTTCMKWDRVIEEFSLRYGPLLAGWWMDGMYDHSHYDMSLAYNWHSRAAAMKGGHSNCAISFGGCRPVGSPYEDYYNGETLGFASLPKDGQWGNEDPVTKKVSPVKKLDYDGAWLESNYRMQWLSYSPVGQSDGGWGAWGNKGCVRNPQKLDTWLKKVQAEGGVVMLDGKVNRLGHIDPAQLKLYLETPACHPARRPDQLGNKQGRFPMSKSIHGD
jgi:hypothetical protein